jgi:hypothetical protein
VFQTNTVVGRKVMIPVMYQCFIRQATSEKIRCNLKSINFWDITPCSPLSVNRRFGGTYACHLLACWFLAEIISSALKMEAICSSRMLVDTQRTTWRYIPEVSTLHNHRYENLKSKSTFNLICASCKVATQICRTRF